MEVRILSRPYSVRRLYRQFYASYLEMDTVQLYSAVDYLETHQNMFEVRNNVASRWGRVGGGRMGLWESIVMETVYCYGLCSSVGFDNWLSHPGPASSRQVALGL